MKILVALSRFPYPIDKGDKLRAFYQIQGLSQRHEIHLVCLHENPVSPAHLAEIRKYCKSVTLVSLGMLQKGWNLFRGIFNGLPCQVNYFRSARMRSRIREVIRRENIDLMYVQLIRIGLNIPHEMKIPAFLDYMDAFSVGMENRVSKSGGLRKKLESIEAARLRAFEKRVALPYEGFSIISEQDADALPPMIREQILIVPNGVGEGFLSSGEARQARDWEYDLLFSGNMGYHHNVEAARFLVEKVLPELDQLGFQARVCLAGTSPAPAVRALAGERVTVTGFVEDIRPFFQKSRLYVAPLVSGQGLQNKLLESMAMGMPTLTSPLANAALHARPGEEILVCRNEKEFAQQIRGLLENPAEATRIAQNGREFVKQNYEWEASNRLLETALKNLLKFG